MQVRGWTPQVKTWRPADDGYPPEKTPSKEGQKCGQRQAAREAGGRDLKDLLQRTRSLRRKRYHLTLLEKRGKLKSEIVVFKFLLKCINFNSPNQAWQESQLKSLWWSDKTEPHIDNQHLQQIELFLTTWIYYEIVDWHKKSNHFEEGCMLSRLFQHHGQLHSY